MATMMMTNHRDRLMWVLGALLAANTLAADTTDLLAPLRTAVPAGWQPEKEAGTAAVHVRRAQLIAPTHLTLHPVPSSPAFGEGSFHYAETNGISVWFYIEPVGVCSETEYTTRKAHNAGIWDQLEPLRKKIESIPMMPRVKPSFLSRSPRNDEEKSWITEWNDLWRQLQVLPTHHYGDQAFMVELLKSYWGATITATQVQEEISQVKGAIESVLVPYESVQTGKPK